MSDMEVVLDRQGNVEIEAYADMIVDYINVNKVVRWQWPDKKYMDLHNQMNHIFADLRKVRLCDD